VGDEGDEVGVGGAFGGADVVFAVPFDLAGEGAAAEVGDVFGYAAGDVVDRGRVVADDDRARPRGADPRQGPQVTRFHRFRRGVAAQLFAFGPVGGVFGVPAHDHGRF